MKKRIGLLIVPALVILTASCGSKSGGSPSESSDPPMLGQGFLSAGQPVTGVQPEGMQAADTSWIKVKHLDLAYASKSPVQKLDLYLPDQGKGPFPLIIEFHPGGFMVGSKSTGIGPMLEGLKRGYAVASVGYRLSGEAAFPAAVNDAKAAVKFLRASAGTYNLDPRHFAAWGSSAGGNLAAMVAVSANDPSLADPSLGNAGVSDAVQAAVDWYGPLDFSSMDAQFTALGKSGSTGTTSSPDSPESKYLGKTVGTPEAQALAEKADPGTYITSDDPPMYIQHGTEDRNVPITQSENFARDLAAAIGADKVVYESIGLAGHGGPLFEAAANVAKILDFLDRHLK